jgi:hypothetical protein
VKPTQVFQWYQECSKRCCSLGDLNLTNKTNKQPSFIDRYAWIGLVLVLGSSGTIKPKWRRVRNLLVGQKSDIRNFLHKQKVQTWGRHHMGWHLVFRRLWWSSQFHHITVSATPKCNYVTAMIWNHSWKLSTNPKLWAWKNAIKPKKPLQLISTLWNDLSLGWLMTNSLDIHH